MGTHKYLVQIAWDVVTEFMEEWKSAPHAWAQEIDVQVELASRLTTVYSALGKNTIESRHSGDGENAPLREFRRVAYEPYVSLSKRNSCKPDIVIWDQGNPDKYTINDGEWPMLFACEIKYKTAWSEIGTKDVRNLTTLLRAGKDRLVEGACIQAVDSIRPRARIRPDLKCEGHWNRSADSQVGNRLYLYPLVLSEHR